MVVLFLLHIHSSALLRYVHFDFLYEFPFKTCENTVHGKKWPGERMNVQPLLNSLEIAKFLMLPQLLMFCVLFLSGIDSSDDDSSSEGDEMPWQQMWLSSDSDLDYDALRRENNWLVWYLLFGNKSVCYGSGSLKKMFG